MVACPACGSWVTYVASYRAYYCARCGKYYPETSPPTTAPTPFPAPRPQPRPAALEVALPIATPVAFPVATPVAQQPAGDAGVSRLPPELKKYPEYLFLLPPAPPGIITLHANPKRLDPRVRSEELGNVRSGLMLNLSDAGEAFLAAAREVVPDAAVKDVQVTGQGMPWTMKLSGGGFTATASLTTVTVAQAEDAVSSQVAMSMFGAGVAAGTGAQTLAVLSVAMSGKPEQLALAAHGMVERLGWKPWDAPHWRRVDEAVHQPPEVLMRDWMLCLNYGAAIGALKAAVEARDTAESVKAAGIGISDLDGRLAGLAEALRQRDFRQTRQFAGEILEQLGPLRELGAGFAELDALIGSSGAAAKDIEAKAAAVRMVLRERGAAGAGEAERLMEAALDGARRAAREELSGRLNRLADELREADATPEMLAPVEECRSLIGGGDYMRAGGALAKAEEDAAPKLAEVRARRLKESMEEVRRSYNTALNTVKMTAVETNRFEEMFRRMVAESDAGHGEEAALAVKSAADELQMFMDSAEPKFMATVVGERLTTKNWNRCTLVLRNTGRADARNVRVGIEGPVEAMAIDDVDLLRAGGQYDDEVAIRSETPGSIALRIVVSYERAFDRRPGRREVESWLDFAETLDLSKAQSITIDRSIRISDSVVQRTSLGMDDTAERVENSVVVPSPPKPAQPDGVACPSCGTIIMKGWKRCPFCS